MRSPLPSLDALSTTISSDPAGTDSRQRPRKSALFQQTTSVETVEDTAPILALHQSAACASPPHACDSSSHVHVCGKLRALAHFLWCSSPRAALCAQTTRARRPRETDRGEGRSCAFGMGWSRRADDSPWRTAAARGAEPSEDGVSSRRSGTNSCTRACRVVGGDVWRRT